MSESLPFRVTPNAFPKGFRGVFGRFKTNTSFPLNYVLTSLPVSRLDDLKTAADAFPLDQIRFEEMIQRDIDYDRVKDIARDYLEKGQGQVVFFPPLLVSLLIKNGNGKITLRYDDIREDIVEQEGLYRKVWDETKFKIELPLAPATYPAVLKCRDQDVHFYEFGAELRYNPTSVDMVVIDGQHRLEAIRLLASSSDKKPIVNELEIPLCIVYPPDAFRTGEEDIAKDLRKLFYTVNSTSRKVSGHFLTLLKDDSLAAKSVRAFANYWKAQPLGDFTRLHLLEWNQRIDERTSQLTRSYSITTVSIINDVLRDHLYDAELADQVLLLESRESELETLAPDADWRAIRDGHWDRRIEEVIGQQIDKTIVPSLDVLFTKPAPYARVQQRLLDSLAYVRNKVQENVVAYIDLKKRLSAHLYTDSDIETENTRAAFEEFVAKVGEPPAEDQVYLKNVFQQGLIRAWIEVALILKPRNISPSAAATSLVVALGELCLNASMSFLGTDQPYTARILFRGRNLIVKPSWAKEAWFNVIILSLLHEKTISAMRADLATQGVSSDAVRAALEEMKELAEVALSEYVEQFYRQTFNDTKRSYADLGYTQSKIRQLRRLENSESPDDQKEFKDEITALTRQRVTPGIEALANVVGLQLAEVEKYLP